MTQTNRAKLVWARYTGSKWHLLQKYSDGSLSAQTLCAGKTPRPSYRHNLPGDRRLREQAKWQAAKWQAANSLPNRNLCLLCRTNAAKLPRGMVEIVER